MFSILYNYLNAVLKVKIKWLCVYIMAVTVKFVYSHDGMANWELWLATAVHDITKEYNIAYHYPRKTLKYKVQSTVSIECILVLHHHRVEKIVKLNHCKLGIAYI